MAAELNSKVGQNNAWIGAAISAGAGLINGLVGADSARKNAEAAKDAQREANEANLRLAREQNQWNLAQWNRENAYNTPAMQMARYRQAGINPYMAVGQVTGGNAAGGLNSAELARQRPLPGVDPQAQGAAVGVQNSMDAFMQLAQTFSQIQNQQSQARLFDEQARSEAVKQLLDKSKKIGQDYDNAYKFEWQKWRLDNHYWDRQTELLQHSVAKAFQEAENLKADFQIKEKEYAIAEEVRKQKVFDTQHQEEKWTADLNLVLQQIQRLKDQSSIEERNLQNTISLTPALLGMYAAQELFYKNNAGYLFSQTQQQDILNRILGAQEGSLIALNDAQNEELKQQALFRGDKVIIAFDYFFDKVLQGIGAVGDAYFGFGVGKAAGSTAKTVGKATKRGTKTTRQVVEMTPKKGGGYVATTRTATVEEARELQRKRTQTKPARAQAKRNRKR